MIEEGSKSGTSDDALTWKDAIAKAWRENGRDYVLRSVILSSIASILRMLQGFFIQGLVIWITLGSVMLILHVIDGARLQRKIDRDRKNPSRRNLTPYSSKEGM